MPTSRPSLSYDVFVAPEKPFAAPPPRVGDPPAWDPTTSTLIFGARDAVLVDPLMTVREATALAGWVELHDRRLTTVYITHGHSDLPAFRTIPNGIIDYIDKRLTEHHAVRRNVHRTSRASTAMNCCFSFASTPR